MKKFMPLIFMLAPLIVWGAVKSKEVTVVNPVAGIELAGTLTAPTDAAPRAAVLLVSGSGAQDRDEEIMGHRPFRAIAEHLSANGYAVLRVDDRGAGASTGSFDGSTTDDFVGDAAACLAFLDSCWSGVPRGIIGHSEGGIVAVRSAVSNPRCNFIVTLGGPAWSGDSIIMSQTRAIATAMTGRWDGEPVQRKVLDIVKMPVNATVASMMLWQLSSEQFGAAADMPEVRESLSQQIKVLTSPWYRAFIAYNPAADIAAVRVPYTAINGGRDFQVLPDNLETIRELNPAAETVLLPGLNHLMLECQTGLVQEYPSLPGDIAPAALDAILKAVDRSVVACQR